MQVKTVRIEKEGAIALVVVDRPQALNALNKETLEGLLECFIALSDDSDIQVVILTGSGEKAFVAGADISHMQELDVLTATILAELGHQVMNAIENLPQPVIAAVNGFALGGGCELAIACDIRVASENAKFGQPEVNLGVIPGFGGTQRLPRLIGMGRACELIYTGDMIDAKEAMRIGLVNRVVPQEELIQDCRKMAEKIVAKGTVAIRLAKQTIHAGMEMDLARANHLEATTFGSCFASADQHEGMAAFLEKRKPIFKGK